MLRRALLFLLTLSLLLLAAFFAYTGWYGINNELLKRGGTWWVTVTPDDSRLPDWMRMALHDPMPDAQPGPFQWKRIADGFDTAELPVLAGAKEVDRILLARISPAHFRFEVHNGPAGNRELGDWMNTLGAALVINASYFTHDAYPDTPIISNGVAAGPKAYGGRHGAFVASGRFTGIRDLRHQDWRTAFAGANNAFVSYPLLVAQDDPPRVKSSRLWLANRSFVGQDGQGNIILGTTQHAFFSLTRLASFLKIAPLKLTLALNMDGGPVACQGIKLGGFTRDFCGEWELAVHGENLKLLTPGFNHRTALPMVLAVFPK